jgi:predicted 3-demethylubiquinone-9 3-methyltransferase (glyoxalase superfamily)
MFKGSKIKPFLWFEHRAEEAARFWFFGDPNRARRVMPALLKMVKLDIRQLEEAAR